MLLPLNKVEIPSGQRIIFKDINWSEFEQILTELGSHRNTRIAYSDRQIEIMTPLPEHEFNKITVSDLIKIILEEMDLEFYPLGSTTFKNELMKQGIEPDDCFYIKNEGKVRGKKRLDLSIDPPPDLALEIDLYSRTHVNIYEALGVPELWRFEQGKLEINLLENGKYVQSEFSAIFANLPIKEIIPKYLNQVQITGRNKTMKEFRNWIKANL